MSICLRTVACLGLLSSLGAWAADPISWSLTPSSGFPTTKVGEQSVVRYSFTNHLPFAARIVLSKKITGGNFVIHDECNNALKPGATCVIGIAFNPANDKKSSIQLTYGYDKNRIPLPTLFAQGGGSTESSLSGVIRGLPPVMYKGNTVDYTAIYTNKGTKTLNNCSYQNFTASGIKASLTTTAGVPPCGSSLAAGASCQWKGSATTNNLGVLTISQKASCTSGTVTSNPKASTHVENKNSCAVHAQVDLPLPQSTHQYSDNIVRFRFANECTTPVTLEPIKVVATGINAIVTQSSSLNTCSTHLAAGKECVVLASIIPQSAGGVMSVTASTHASTGVNVQAITSASVLKPAYQHSINFINQCPFNVWYGVENSTGNPNVQDPTPNPSPNAYKLAQQSLGLSPVVKSITIPGNYLGEFFPRTGCSIKGSKFVCQTADCDSPASTGTCNGDATSPFTRIEEVFFSSIQGAGYQGTYDLSLINGLSIPVEMKGLGPANSNPVFDDTPFYCTGAGAPIQPPQPAGSETLGQCGWQLTVPTSNKMQEKLFNFVSFTAHNENCTSTCPSGEVCGLAYNSAHQIDTSCGQLIGYWTINQSCSANSNYVANIKDTNNPKVVFNCAQSYPGKRYPDGATYYDIYSCNTPAGNNPNQLGSCYPSTSGDLCCGAQNWNLQTPYLTAQDINAGITNPDWTTGSSLLIPSPYDSILWIKNACPTAYVYPYDDHSSSFRCYTSDSAQKNIVKMDFDVVFCPGGLTGNLSLNP